MFFLSRYASYVYLSMYTYFSRDDVALPGFAKMFKKNSDEEREHATKLINYQNMRGGRVVFQDIAKPNKSEWESPLEAVEAALELEKTVNQVSQLAYKNIYLCGSCTYYKGQTSLIETKTRRSNEGGEKPFLGYGNFFIDSQMLKWLFLPFLLWLLHTLVLRNLLSAVVALQRICKAHDAQISQH